MNMFSLLYNDNNMDKQYLTMPIKWISLCLMLLFSPFSLYSYKDNVVNDIIYSFSELGSIYFPCWVTLFMPASKHVNGLYSFR